MSMSTVISGAIILTAIVMSIALFVAVFVAAANYLHATIESAATTIKMSANARLAITSGLLNGSTLCINVTNYGGNSVVLAQGTIVLIDYIDNATSSRHIDTIPYDKIVVNKVYIGNYTINVGAHTAIELAPNVIAELCFTPSSAINTSYPVTVVLALSTGIKATRVLYLGG